MKRGAAAGATGSVRIIAGTWRSRRLLFPARLGLRPTPDRVRETLFNWLAPHLPGARCLDLFAGSGALGFEALSRGAARVVLVERDPAAADAAEVRSGDAGDYLDGPVESFDIVFLDPPYTSGLLSGCMQRLAARDWLCPAAWVYLEAREGELPPLPEGWRLLRSKTAGQVGYHLVRTTHKEAA